MRFKAELTAATARGYGRGGRSQIGRPRWQRRSHSLAAAVAAPTNAHATGPGLDRSRCRVEVIAGRVRSLHYRVGCARGRIVESGATS